MPARSDKLVLSMTAAAAVGSSTPDRQGGTIMKRMSSTLVRALVMQSAIVIGSSIAAPPAAPAASFTWTGPGGTENNPTSGNWNVDANWAGDPAVRPTSDRNSSLVFKSGTGAYTA